MEENINIEISKIIDEIISNFESTEIMEEENTCCICYELLTINNDYTITKCNHEYHFSCILKYALKKNNEIESNNITCPICRKEFIEKQINNNNNNNNNINLFSNSFSENERFIRRSMYQEENNNIHRFSTGYLDSDSDIIYSDSDSISSNSEENGNIIISNNFENYLTSNDLLARILNENRID